MQYGTESKLYFKAYKDDGTTVTSLGGVTTCWISKDGGAFHACTNTPVYVGNYSWFCLTLTATETTCDSLVIKVTPSTSGITVQDIIGEPQRVTPATDTSTLATASSVSTLQTSVNAVFGLAGNFVVTDNVLMAYNDGTTIAVYDLTRDQSGNITAIEPRSTT